MKRVWQVIDREMRNEGLTARQMAEKLGMDPAHLSRLRTGQLRDLSPESLVNLVNGLGSSRELHSEVLAAYLSDKLEGSAAVPREILSEAATEIVMREEAPIYRTTAIASVPEACIRMGLNRRVADAIGDLAEQAQTNRRLQALLISLADFSAKK